jgi:O-antigen ligase
MHESLAGARTVAPGAALPARPGLLWTDAWFLAGIAIAALNTVDPFGLELAVDTMARHLPLLVALSAVAMALLLRMALPDAPSRAGVRPLADSLAAAWPLVLFAAMAASGGIYARHALGADTTFLNYGLYATMTFGAAAMVLQCAAPMALLRGYFAILLAAALVMCVFLVAYAGTRQVYHEQIFLVIPMAALFFAGTAPSFLRWTAAAFFLVMAWFSHKYTSYLLAALTAAYLAVFIWVPRFSRNDPLAWLTAVYWGALGFLAAAGSVAVAYLMRGGSDHPTGNLEFRLHTYGLAWERFLESPLWGSWYSREGAEKFTLYDIGIARNTLPTHSDVLDILANGGALGFGLCAAGLLLIAVLAWRRLLRPALIEAPEARYAHTLALLSLAAILTCAFNPILLQPPMAALAWSNLGMLLGLSLRAERSPPSSGGPPRR